MEKIHMHKDFIPEDPEIYVSLESRPTDYEKYLSFDDEGKEKFLTDLYNQYDPHFFLSKRSLPFPNGYLVQRGDILLHNSRLTPEDVCDIVRSGELEDYDYLTKEQTDACQHYCLLKCRSANDLARYGAKEFYFRFEF